MSSDPQFFSGESSWSGRIFLKDLKKGESFSFRLKVFTRGETLRWDVFTPFHVQLAYGIFRAQEILWVLVFEKVFYRGKYQNFPFFPFSIKDQRFFSSFLKGEPASKVCRFLKGGEGNCLIWKRLEEDLREAEMKNKTFHLKVSLKKEGSRLPSRVFKVLVPKTFKPYVF